MTYDITNVSVIIPNWNGKLLLERHLPSVVLSTKGAEIIVVDDASTDDSVLFLKKRYPQIKIIQKNINEGFSSTVNIGVKNASGSLILLLNSDIEPEKNFLKPIFSLFEDPSLFAVGLTDNSVEKNTVVTRGRAVAVFQRGMYIHSRGEINKQTTAWVSGGSGVFNKEIWNKLGGMDPLFNPFYWEDIDLSYRAMKKGYTIRFESSSIVVHKHDDGAIKQTYSKAYVRTIAFRNQLLFIWKNITDFDLLLLHIVWLPYHLVKAIIDKNYQFLHGFLMALRIFPRVYKKRINNKKNGALTDKEIFQIIHY